MEIKGELKAKRDKLISGSPNIVPKFWLAGQPSNPDWATNFGSSLAGIDSLVLDTERGGGACQPGWEWVKMLAAVIPVTPDTGKLDG